MDADEYFAHPHDHPMQRNNVFINRAEFCELFVDRLKEHSQERYPPQSLLNFDRPVRNILVFHGEGGIGKTAIISELRRVYVDLDNETMPRRRALVSLDMSDYNNHNFETLLIRLRAGLGQAAKSWPSFDRGISRFWALKYPGLPLTQFIARTSYLNKQERSDLAAQISGAADTLLGTMGAVSFGYWLTKTLASKILPPLPKSLSPSAYLWKNPIPRSCLDTYLYC